MIQKNIISIILVIGLFIFAFLYFTKKPVVVNDNLDKIEILMDSIEKLDKHYNEVMLKERDSMTVLINKKDSILEYKQKELRWIQRKHKKELDEIKSLPNDSVYRIFNELTNQAEINDTSYYKVHPNRIRVATITMMRSKHISIEFDSLVSINNTLVSENNDLKHALSLCSEREINLLDQISKLKETIDLDKIEDERYRKEVRKQKWRQGVVVFASGAAAALLVIVLVQK